MTALVIISHQPADWVERMVDYWQQLASPEHILVAYGGTENEFSKIKCRKVFIDDERLRTTDHQREKQSYTGVLAKALEELTGNRWDYLYLAEFDIEPLVSDLWARLETRMAIEGADLLIHRCWRVDDTLHPHYADHSACPEWDEWIRTISVRDNPSVVLSGMGCGQFWSRPAVEGVVAVGEPFPAYLELHLPTVAHHLGFRVRGMGEQDHYVLPELISPERRDQMVADGAWIIHPNKNIWSHGTDPKEGSECRAVRSVLHMTHFDPVIHGEAAMASQLRDLAIHWLDLEYIAINTRYVSKRDDLGSVSLKKLFFTVRYLWDLFWIRLTKWPDLLLIHPAFFSGTFLKESLFIWLGRLMGMKVVAWIHMDPARMELENRNGLMKFWVEQTLNRTGNLVAVASGLTKQWPEWIPNDRVLAIPNGIEDPTSGGELAKPGSQSRLRVMYLSAIDPEKGWKELFQVAIELCGIRDDLEFHFYGGVSAGELEEEIARQFSMTGHTDRIHWHGPVYGPEKAKAFREADIFVLPSYTEQFPISVLEAMAFGLPIVASRVGAIEDAVKEPEGGCLIEARSIDSLKAGIVDLATMPEALDGIGAFNRRRFIERYSLARFEDHWHHFLRDGFLREAGERTGAVKQESPLKL